MALFLIKKFIKNPDAVDSRAEYGKLSGTVGIVCNVALFIAKLFAGFISGSISVMGDAMNNLSDASSSIISLIGFKMSSKSADFEHPYGHARYEYLSGLIIAVMIIVIGIELLKTSIMKIFSPSDIDFGVITAVILISSMAVKFWLARFNTKIGRLINSGTLAAAAADSYNDVVSTGAVLAVSLISHFTSFNLDGIMGTIVGIIILLNGAGLVKTTIDPLLGKAPDPRLVKNIRDTVLGYNGVLGTHDLMVHDYGPGRTFASVHVEMAAEADILESHEIIDDIERDFMMNHKINMVIHLDPISTSDEEVNNFRIWLSKEVKTIHSQITIHDLRMVYGRQHTNAIFDCVKPHDIEMSDAELEKRISELVSQKYPNYFCVITVDSDFAPITHEK